jgi:hypothetical protein
VTWDYWPALVPASAPKCCCCNGIERQVIFGSAGRSRPHAACRARNFPPATSASRVVMLLGPLNRTTGGWWHYMSSY